MDYLEQSKQAWKVAGTFSPSKEEVYPEHGVVQEFDLIRDKKVYEYGCGGGSDVMSYLRRGNHVTATDIVPENLEVTKSRVAASGLDASKINLVLLESSYPLPFPDNEFDVVSSHGVLHHIKDVDPVIHELYRVCKKGGHIYVMLYTDILWEHHAQQMERFIQMSNIDKYEAFCWCTDGPGTPYARCYTTDQACKFLEDVGFQVVDYTHWLNDFFITIKGVK